MANGQVNYTFNLKAPTQSFRWARMLSENLNSGGVCKNIEETGQMNGWAFVDQREKLWVRQSSN